MAATAALHEEVGPARTTLAEVARRAGVERLTVYNNFPTLEDLVAACQAHFLAAHPPPPIAPEGRVTFAALERSLAAIYGWYRANRRMERNVHRDRHAVPALDRLMRANADPALAAAAARYAAELGRDPAGRQAVGRMLSVALDFRTWETIAESGADDAEIARLFTAAARCIAPAGPAGSRRRLSSG